MLKGIGNNQDIEKNVDLQYLFGWEGVSAKPKKNKNIYIYI